ncbi:hypothetical protein RN001_016005 [Aquatica leii]|uniref:Uncharacterized protein n=1 Tax=Aquatica leii TaxID=1421715 RepID=A0AAN7P159_9COLE|nr:hypothetical protein RN001_016005 [Aquatica leii]
MANNEDSVEDFAFSGSLTLHEIRKILSLEKDPRQIKNRSTIEVSQPTRTIYDESPEVNLIIERNLLDKQEIDVNPAFISEYFHNVPQYVHTSDKEPSNFIEQLSDVLRLNDSGTEDRDKQDSSYKSDTSYEDSLIIISDCEESCADFKPVGNVKTEINATISSEGQEMKVCNKGLFKNNNINNSVICIDDDDEINVPSSNYSPYDIKNVSSIKTEDCEHSKENSYCPSTSSSSHQDHKESTNASESSNDSLNASVDYSNSSNKSFKSNESQDENTFNDTLEEIEMALKYGLNYTMPDDNSPKSTNENVRNSPVVESNENITEASVSSAPTTGYIDNYTPYQKKTKDFQFKQPTQKPISTKSKTPNYKDVVSPVAVYIKNTPRCPILRNVPTSNTWQKKALFRNHDTPTISKSNKENVLPEVVYTLPRQVIKTEGASLKLPSNIKKHLPSVPNLIKHKGRVAPKKQSPSKIQEKLLSCDLSIDDSKTHLNLTVPLDEVSLHYTKEVYIP